MGSANKTLEHTRGETIKFAISGDPAFDGTETVDCDVKLAESRNGVPPSSTASLATATSAFNAILDDLTNVWVFTLSSAQSDALDAGVYVFDIRILSGSDVQYSDPVAIELCDNITEPA